MAANRPGYVYALINYSMPGVVKIGFTERPPPARSQELSGSTGVPTPFELVYDILVPDAPTAERILHDHLAPHRVSDNREFFSVPIHAVVKLMIQLREQMEAKAVSGGQPSVAVVTDDAANAQEIVVGDWDELFEDAAVACIRAGQRSTSLLQRSLRIGYGRAARIMDQLEGAGVLGPQEGAEPRRVLVDRIALNQILDSA